MMSEPPSQVQQPDSNLHSSHEGQPPFLSLDLIARTTAPALLLIYGLGFIVLGFHDARYGVVQFSPFRTRIVLAGLVFTVLVGLSAWAQHSRLGSGTILMSVRSDTDPKRHFFKETVLAAGFIFPATIMSFALGLFLFASVRSETREKWWHLVAWVVLATLFEWAFFYIDRIFATRPRGAAALAVLAAVFYLGATIDKAQP